MKWGIKKCSPPSRRTSLVTRVFPASWFSKLKQKGGSPETNSGKKQQRCKLDFPTRYSSFPAGWSEARFHSMDEDDDAYWRFSFREERVEDRRTGRNNPLWCDSDDEFQVPVLSHKSFSLKQMEFPRGLHESIDDMVLNIEKMTEKRCSENILRENGIFRKKKPNRGAQLRKEDVNSRRRSRKLSRRVVRKKKAEFGKGLHDGEGKSSEPVKRDIFPKEPDNTDQMKEEFRDSDDEDYVFAAMDGEVSNASSELVSVLNSQNLEKKFKEIKVKTKSPVKSAKRRSYSRKTEKTRIKAYAPKTDCRIRVLDDMQKARIKLKKKETKDQEIESSTTFNSFAVMKRSFKPEQDFRDSMVEMIRYNGIRRPKELEELLACYLTLNCDGYHDLIIDVFQQVWFELRGDVN